MASGLTTGALAGSNKGGGDVFVRKYRPNGSIAWTRQFGSAAPEQATDMVVDRRGRVVVVGVTEGTLPGQTNKGDQDAFVRVYRPNGSVAWTRQFGSAQGEQVGAVAVDKGGSIYVAGSTAGALPGLGNKGGEDAFVRKLRPNGSVAWTRQFGSNQTDLAVGAAVDPSASLVVSGTSSGALPGQVSKGMTDAFVRKFR
jgi:hypothetical protein